MDRAFLAWPFVPAEAAPVHNRAAAWTGKNVSLRLDSGRVPKTQLLGHPGERFRIATDRLGARRGKNHATH
jgi:alkylation response protein AidB-like acyl-CoA dehydrogenase